jgi:hypothetical protein
LIARGANRDAGRRPDFFYWRFRVSCEGLFTTETQSSLEMTALRGFKSFKMFQWVKTY